MNKTKLFLHIGHGKTGTSAIQSSLAIASEKLAALGIEYPINAKLRDRASQLEITSGNWKAKSETSLTEQLLEITRNNKNNSTIILSSESLFWLIPDLLSRKSDWGDFIDLHIIMAVREVEEMLSSEYQQLVKRHGNSMLLGQFIRTRNFVSSHHAKAAEIIDLMSQHKTSNTIINYSKHRKDISRLVFKLIGAEEAYPEDKMAGAVINRSLSRKELDFLIMINKLYHNKFPSISTTISDALIKRQPNLEAGQYRISEKQLEKIYKKNEAALQKINACLDSNEQLSTHSIPNKQPKEDTHSSAEQIRRMREEELLSVKVIRDTLLEVLTTKPKQAN